MKIYNKGKSSIQYGLDVTHVLGADQTIAVSDEIGKKLVALYPRQVVDVENIRVDDLRAQPVAAAQVPTQAPSAISSVPSAAEAEAVSTTAPASGGLMGRLAGAMGLGVKDEQASDQQPSETQPGA